MSRNTLRTLCIVTACLILIATMFLMRPPLPSVAAGASVSLSLTYGPPTSAITMGGKGFKSREIVTLSFDTIPVRTTTTNSTGSFSSPITVPASALPGNHFVQARGKSSNFFALATFLVQTDWVQEGFNRAHTNYNPFENVVNAANVGNLVVDWQTTEGNTSLSTAPTIVHGMVYVDSPNEVYAFNAITGALLWSYAPGNSINAAPAIQNGILYFGSYNHKLYALNATTGTLLWSFTTGDLIFSAPLIANGLVYVASGDSYVYALNSTTGKPVWKYKTGNLIDSAPALGNNGMLYVSSFDHKLYALKATTGAFVWSYNTTSEISAPVVDNGTVYVISNNTIYAVKTPCRVLCKDEGETSEQNSAQTTILSEQQNAGQVFTMHR